MNSPLSLNILVVEDNDSLREATVDFLNAHGHIAQGVVNAEDVDDTPTRDVPDLYLIDVNLPGENGFSLAQRIRQSQPGAGIVLMTARAQLNDRLDGYHHGADNYLIKPVEQLELLACIRSLAFRLKDGAHAPPAVLVLDRRPGADAGDRHVGRQARDGRLRADARSPTATAGRCSHLGRLHPWPRSRERRGRSAWARCGTPPRPGYVSSGRWRCRTPRASCNPHSEPCSRR